MGLAYRIEIYPDENGEGFTALIPDLPGCISSGDTPEDALASIDEAKRLWLEVALDQGDPVPEPTPLTLERFSGRFLVRSPRSLHRRLVERAGLEGVSLNQLVVSIISESMGRARSSQSYTLQFEAILKTMRKREFAWTQYRSGSESPSLTDWTIPIEIKELAVRSPNIVPVSPVR